MKTRLLPLHRQLCVALDWAPRLLALERTVHINLASVNTKTVFDGSFITYSPLK